MNQLAYTKQSGPHSQFSTCPLDLVYFSLTAGDVRCTCSDGPPGRGRVLHSLTSHTVNYLGQDTVQGVTSDMTQFSDAGALSPGKAFPFWPEPPDAAGPSPAGLAASSERSAKSVGMNVFRSGSARSSAKGPASPHQQRIAVSKATQAETISLVSVCIYLSCCHAGDHFSS